MANVVLFGPPGAGKGTQSDFLVKEFNLFKVSAGDLLREEIKKKTSLGNEIKLIIDKGFLVKDKIIDTLIDKIISKEKHHNSLIFDGYPRNLNQVKTLDSLLKKYNQKLSCVFCLKVDKDVIIKRILGRQTCSKCGMIFNIYFSPPNQKTHNCDVKFLQKRSDDNEETINNRLKTYDKETLPILEYYRNQKLLYEIDGLRDIPIIYKEIQQIMRTLET